MKLNPSFKYLALLLVIAHVTTSATLYAAPFDTLRVPASNVSISPKGSNSPKSSSSKKPFLTSPVIVALIASFFIAPSVTHSTKPETSSAIGIEINIPAQPTIESLMKVSSEQREIIQGLTSWLATYTNSETGLPSSHVGDVRFANWCFTYDAAITCQAYMQIGDIEKAKKIIEYYLTREGIWRLRGIINAVDAANPRDTGKGVEWVVHAGPNIHVGIASYQLYLRTKDTKYIEFAKRLADFSLSLQNTDKKDKNYGAIRMGPRGKDSPKDQRINWDENAPSWYEIYSTEHNIDAWALFNMLYSATEDAKYSEARDKIFKWLKSIAYNREGSYFNRGYKEKGYMDEPAGIDTIIATDVQFWAISSLGVVELDKIESGLAEKLMKFAEDNCKVTVEYTKPNGTKVTVTGFDYTDKARQRGINRGAMVTPEWTSEGANADTRLSLHAFLLYNKLADQARKDKEFSKAAKYRQKALALINNMIRLVTVEDGVLSLPYATLLDAPTGHGWNTPRCHASTIGNAYLGYDRI